MKNSTSAQNGRVVDMKPLLLVIKRTMHLATTGISGIVPLEDPGVQDEKILFEISSGIMHDLLTDTVSKISCEISCKCSGVQAKTETIVETLSSYPTETQILVALAAFAVNYGNFWLVLSQSNELTKYVTLLQQLPSLFEPAAHDTLKLKFEALNDVIKVVLDVTDCIFEVKGLPPQFISRDIPALSTANAYISQAALVIIQTIVICSSHITQLISTEIMDPSRVESLELSNQYCAVTNIHKKLKTQLVICQKHVEAAKDSAAVQEVNNIFGRSYTNNQLVLATMFSTNLIDSSNTMVEIVKLKGKNVLVFISDLDVDGKVFSQFHQFYNDWKNKQNQEMEFQFVWVPMVDESIKWTTELRDQYLKKLNSLSWYMVCDPTCLDRKLIRYIKEVWQYKHEKQILVVLDHKGRVVNPNAIHIVLTFGSSAFGFLEVGGWKEETWSIQFLTVFSFDPWINQWVQAGEYICLYGGDDIQWLEKFNEKVKKFEGNAKKILTTNIKINMLYVGKSNRKENVRKCVEKFSLEGNREEFMEKIRLFWQRVESMWYSKMQSIENKKSEGTKDDNMMKEILTMLSFDGSNQGWALISDCSGNMAKGQGDFIETCLDEPNKWIVHVKAGESFVPKLNEHLREKLIDDHCCLPVILPSTIDIIPPEMPCTICGKPMKKMTTYRCCKD